MQLVGANLGDEGAKAKDRSTTGERVCKSQAYLNKHIFLPVKNCACRLVSKRFGLSQPCSLSLSSDAAIESPLPLGHPMSQLVEGSGGILTADSRFQGLDLGPKLLGGMARSVAR